MGLKICNMKSINKLTALFLIVFTIVSCSKSETGVSSAKKQTISAMISQYENQTKTELSNTDILWSDNDEIIVFNQNGDTFYEFKSDNSGTGTKSAIFTGSASLNANPVYALYPGRYTRSLSSNVLSIYLPRFQEYRDNSFGDGNMTMFGSAASIDDPMRFKALLSLLKISAVGAETIQKVILISNNPVSGIATVDASKGELAMSDNQENTTNYITLDCGNGIDISGGKDFLFALPAGKHNITVRFVNTKGEYFEKTKNGLELTANHIKPMSVLTVNTGNETKYIEGDYIGDGIIVDGKVWAPVNAGYDSKHTFGLLYQWGRKYGVSYSSQWNNADGKTIHNAEVMNMNLLPITKGILASDEKNYILYQFDNGGTDRTDWLLNQDDTRWAAGSDNHNPCPAGWRVPTVQEWRALLVATAGKSPYTIPSLTANETQKGLYFSGSGANGNGSVWIPAAGNRHNNGLSSGRNTSMSYWTSSTKNSNACHSFINSTDLYVDPDQCSAVRGPSFPVRCIKE